MRRTSTTPPRLLPPPMTEVRSAFASSAFHLSAIARQPARLRADSRENAVTCAARFTFGKCFTTRISLSPWLSACRRRACRWWNFPIGRQSDRSVEQPLRFNSGSQSHRLSRPSLRLAISRAVGIESGRGWRITKEKASHKIDVVVALAQAALGAAKQEGRARRRFVRSSGSSLSSLVALRGEARLREQERFRFRACASRAQHSAVIEDSRAEYRAGRNSRHATRAARYRHLRC